MTLDTNDPRLTAYALGELEGEAKREVEEAVAASPELRAEVETLRGLGRRLEIDLKDADADLGLDPARRDAVRRGASPSAPAGRRLALGWRAAAAALLIAGLGVFLYRSSTSPEAVDGLEREMAHVEATKARGGRTRPEDRRDAGIKASADLGEEEAGMPLGQPVDVFRLEPEPVVEEETTDVWDGFAETREGGRDPTELPAPPPLSGPTTPAAPPPLAAETATAVPGARPGLSIGAEGGDDQVPYALPPAHDTEGYDRIQDNPFVRTADQDTSTFSIDVDTASYANVRRFLTQQGRLPPRGAVRIEEMVNYFPYDYAPPAADAEHPFATHLALATCPWEPKHRLARIALKGKEIAPDERPALNLVFLLDVSGSMNHPNKLELVKQAMALLVPQLGAQDRVSIAVYAGAAGLVLPTTPGDRHHEILAALDRLSAGGSTNGGAGIGLAYKTAREAFIEGGANRVILCTDGDFNVGVSDRDSLTRLVESWAKSGVFLSVLGFGMGNYKDGSMEELSNRGQRQLRLRRQPAGGAEGPRRARARDPRDDRQGREDPGRLQPRRWRASA